MRIGIIGTGGVGGYFGALLAAAGADVVFMARGAHLAAMQRDGLLLTGPKGDTRIHPVTADSDPAKLGPIDVALFCVKLYDTEAVGRAIAPALAEDGYVISLQNGVESADILTPILGPGRVCPGNAYMSALIREPGVVAYTSNMSAIDVGELDGTMSDRLRRFANAGVAAGFDVRISDNIRRSLWTKLVVLAANSGFTALLRQPMKAIYGDPEVRALAEDSMREVVAVARANGVELAPDVIQKSLALADSLPDDMYASMYHDLARGRPIEVENLSGAVYRLGKRRGVDTPIHRTVYCALRPYIAGAQE